MLFHLGDGFGYNRSMIQKAVLVLSLVVSPITFAQDFLENIPATCQTMMLNADGIRLDDYYKTNPDQCKDDDCKKFIQKMQENEKREKLPKSIEKVKGTRLDEKEWIKNRLVTKGNTNLRDEPRGKVIGTLPDNTMLLILGKSGNWLYVRGYWKHECQTGWTYKDNLEAESATKTGQ